MRPDRSQRRSTRRWAVRMLVVLAVLALTGTMAAPASASVAAPTAQTIGVLTPQERAELPAGARKVTRAGLVHGTIPAQVGDIVLAATVLHASETHERFIDNYGPGFEAVNLRWRIAIEENTSNQVRGYWRFRLTYGANATTWPTYHQGARLRVHRDDREPNQADGCLPYAAHCTWTTDPSDCRGPSPPCGVYQRVSLYRPKGDANDWWLTEFEAYWFWHPNRKDWYPLNEDGCDGAWLQGEWWEVGLSTRHPAYCPEIEGR
jgi:hypothetical protein